MAGLFMSRHKTIQDHEILEIAREVFLEKGHTATTREIAEAVGISQGVLYQRFGSKDDLFLAAMHPSQPDLDNLFDTFAEKNKQDGLEIALVTLAKDILAHFRQVMPLIIQITTHPTVSLSSLQNSHNQVHAQPILARFAEELSTLQELGVVKDIPPLTIASTFIASLHGIVMLEHLSPAHNTEHELLNIEEVVHMLYGGVAQ